MTPLLADLMKQIKAELRKGAIHEAPLDAKGWHLDGLCDYDSGRVYVDPAPSIAEALMHEVLHRRFPRWGEKRVDATAKRLLRSMNSREVRWWYREFRRMKKTSTTPVKAD